jgi:outer membrane protein assembly factor BamD
MKDYYLAGYYFKRFAKNFPNSSRAEECSFNSALCYMKNSPDFYLDQSDTYSSIDEFQLFMNKYPESSLVDSCNLLIKNLRSKLEIKSFEQSSLYFKMEKYRSSIVAFKSTLEKFPDTKFREEILYMIVKANFLFASNSVDTKKIERFEATIDSYLTFVDSFEKSDYLKTAESYYNSSIREIEKQKILN